MVCEEKCSCGRHYRFGTQWIKEVQNYKYLGMELDKKLSFKDFKARMLDKARRNMLRIWYLGIRGGYLSVKASLNLYETLVRTLLEYGSEIWGEKNGLQGKLFKWRFWSLRARYIGETL